MLPHRTRRPLLCPLCRERRRPCSRRVPPVFRPDPLAHIITANTRPNPDSTAGSIKRAVLLLLFFVLTENRSFYATSAVPPASFLVLHPRAIQTMCRDSERKKTKPRKNHGTYHRQIKCKRTSYESTRTPPEKKELRKMLPVPAKQIKAEKIRDEPGYK